MSYIGWTSFYEGSSDRSYFDVLLPRLMEEIIAWSGTRQVIIPGAPVVMLGQRGRTIQAVATEICEAADAYHLVFIHADTGGRNLRRTLPARSSAYCEAAGVICNWPPSRCITVEPAHETEAWVLADPDAVLGALGYNGRASDLGLPTHAAAAEALPDPKQALAAAVRQVRGPRLARGADQLLPAIARAQSFEALRRSVSFRAFEARLFLALENLGCVRRM